MKFQIELAKSFSFTDKQLLLSHDRDMQHPNIVHDMSNSPKSFSYLFVTADINIDPYPNHSVTHLREFNSSSVWECSLEPLLMNNKHSPSSRHGMGVSEEERSITCSTNNLS